MSSISQNGGIIYFRQSSDNTIQYSTNGSNWVLISSTSTVTITNNTPLSSSILTVQFTTNLSLSNVNFYFICNSQYITFNGQNHTCTFNNISGYSGLIQNGTSTVNGFKNITIKNIKTNSTNTTLASGAGWICQSYFGRGVGNILIDKCSSTGEIAGTGSGGILGTFAGANTAGIITVRNCYSTGAINGVDSGGILGASAGANGGNVTVTNCYSTGDITNSNAGGVCGSFAGTSGTVSVTKCYSLGIINGSNAGGICGSNTGSSGTATITNCYSSGELKWGTSGGIIGASSTAAISKCYIAAGAWSDTSAKAALTGAPTSPSSPGSNWSSGSIDSPYFLTSLKPYYMVLTISQSGGTVYFQQGVTSIEYSTSYAPSWIAISTSLLPIIISNQSDDILTIQFNTSLTLSNANLYFICETPYITFDGQNNTCTFNNISNYAGLIQNGTSVTEATGDAFRNITVKNIKTNISGTTTLSGGAGYICQSYFGKSVNNILIDTCSSTGAISINSCGGIVGARLGTLSGTAIVSNCYSKGEISGIAAGGIVGDAAGSSGGNLTVFNCYSTGNITSDGAGGIGGAFNCQTNCVMSISKCYSSGIISGANSGGIIGKNSGISASLNISNCYSSGVINYGFGGILGNSCSATVSNCYIANGIWLDSSANAVSALTGTPSSSSSPGTIWYSYRSNTPYFLVSLPSPIPPPNITNFTVTSINIVGSSFQIMAPTSDSSGAFSYTSSNTSVATISGTTVTCVGAGTSNIIAIQAATTNYTSGTIASTIQVNNKTNPTLSNFSVPTKTYGNSSFQITAPTSDSSGAFSYTSSNTSVATISGTTVTCVGAGSSTITATQAATTNYNTGTITTSFIVNKTNPTLSNFSVPTKTYGNSSFQITAPTSDSTGTFSYTSSNTSVATISGTTVTCVGAGSSTITATQAATTNYNTGIITTSFIVNQATPTLSNFSVLSKTYGDIPFQITAPTSDSTGTFSYTSSNNSVATISGTTVTIVGARSSDITANQSATTNYDSGAITTQFVVSKANPNLSNFSVPIKMYGDIPFQITAPTSDSTGTFSYTSSNTSVATISGTTVTIVGSGSSNITASQGETTNYNSGTITTQFVVSNATPTSNATPISNVCFLAGTPILTNQGNITIEKINHNIHTIRNKKIVGITKTITQDKYLICFEKDALGNNLPSQKTIISKNHCIFYKGKLTQSKQFLGINDKVYKIKYRGEVLYNILMEEHDKMIVNNLICETLHPENGTAKLYKYIQNLNPPEQDKIIKEYNDHVIKNNSFNSKKNEIIK